MNATPYLRPEIAAQLPPHQAVEVGKDGVLMVVLPSGYRAPLDDLVEVDHGADR